MIVMATPSNDQFSGFLTSAEKAAQTILETVKQDGLINVFSHLDADGVAAAGIMGKALFRLDARFRIRITQWIENKIVGEILFDKPQLVIFTDLGSGYAHLPTETLRNV